MIPPPREPALEPVVALRAPRDKIPMATEVRSTWIASSVMSLKEHGYYDAYVKKLPARYLEQVQSMAGGWLPVDVAIAHYEAAGELDLTSTQIWEVSVAVTQRVHKSSIAFALLMAREAGVSPWTIYRQLDKLWERVWRGGAVAVYKVGPKEARVDVVRWPLAELRYIRLAMPAVLHGLTELFCKKAYVTEIPRACFDDNLAFKIAWA